MNGRRSNDDFERASFVSVWMVSPRLILEAEVERPEAERERATNLDVGGGDVDQGENGAS
jgi:hypothetical protein